ncbi:serine/threonine/tyrosine-interacting-like protein 1 isoform X2 [Podarcis raffonei]|uniref:serine/threonine/tyrosine-interacting-like protein 1 isoform X2 n=1 Tax=Podarcis raffonei TaxID=65483 RepID=UPI0023299338|nr:serine/threonine/tyrosine-interacting-like protein 1 isoform X2 [Podarcis raffonei]
MAGVALCEPTELYNMLNQSTKISRLAEPNYLCLMDARTRREYNESHLMTAIRVRKNALGKFIVPPSVNLECVRYCVVYDGKSTSVDAAYDIDYDLYEVDKELTPYDMGEDINKLRTKPSSEENAPVGSAARCARIMQRFTSYPVLVLRGGYELFTATYHYLRTQKIFWMPQELEAFKPYPVEILPARLYMGTYAQACDSQIQKDLKIKAHLNVCEEAGTLQSHPQGKSPGFLHHGHKQVQHSRHGLPHAFLQALLKEVLELRSEMQNQHAAQSGVCATAVRMGDTHLPE